MSVWELRSHYEALRAKNEITNKVEAAEMTFALAVGLRRAAERDERIGASFGQAAEEAGYRKMARQYARECLGVLKELPSESLDEVAPNHTILAGVVIPNYMHVRYLAEHQDIRALVGEEELKNIINAKASTK